MASNLDTRARKANTRDLSNRAKAYAREGNCRDALKVLVMASGAGGAYDRKVTSAEKVVAAKCLKR